MKFCQMKTFAMPKTKMVSLTILVVHPANVLSAVPDSFKLEIYSIKFETDMKKRFYTGDLKTMMRIVCYESLYSILNAFDRFPKPKYTHSIGTFKCIICIMNHTVSYAI